MTTILAVDAGQTAMKVRVVTPSGVRELSAPGIRTDRPLSPQLAEVARAALGAEGGPDATFAAGVSGLTDADADPDELAGALRDVGVRRVVLAHDSTTSYLGALADARGAVVASGTGVVTLAVGVDAVARVDGWGHIMGDAGSGYWIGRAALDAVMRAYDGRGPQTALTERVRERWSVLPGAYVALQSDPARVSVVASFARDVADLAAQADEVAVSITRAAAVELAESVTAGLRRVGEEDDPDAAVCAIGGVFRSALLRQDFADALAGSGVAASVVPPRGEGIDGVLALASLSPEHPLSVEVFASR